MPVQNNTVTITEWFSSPAGGLRARRQAVCSQNLVSGQGSPRLLSCWRQTVCLRRGSKGNRDAGLCEGYGRRPPVRGDSRRQTCQGVPGRYHCASIANRLRQIDDQTLCR
ncbi:hypothetical protein RRG08_042346 [Elysia crispata]|uniref:Uncharacterized protein n=1 Tax=Elysia crispata TaxID=231223 RepID=A0AAE0ZC49_9GAST|nr:hypothetical protein RRG08_042346 [Elysia crispata]